MINPQLKTEYDSLRAVVTHRPAREIDRLTPDNVKSFLFEDIPFLPDMQKEHDAFTRLIKLESDALVLRLDDLLRDVLINHNIKISLLTKSLKKQKLAYLAEEIASKYSRAECAFMLTSGLKAEELKRRVKTQKLSQFSDSTFVIEPLPNAYFMRDPAAVVQSGVIRSHMRFGGRKREPILMETIFENHPLFKDNYNKICPRVLSNNKKCYIEGGDVVVLSSKALAIGQSERTNTEAIKAIAANILADGQVERVYEVSLPNKRTYMHLDTVFTILDENLVLSFPEALRSSLKTTIYTADGLQPNGLANLHAEVKNESLLEVLETEIDNLELVETGGGHPDFAAREQLFDGANVFALGPRRVVAYARNYYTIEALKKTGVEVLPIASSELYRGLGGPRCMTMTISRSEYACQF